MKQKWTDTAKQVTESYFAQFYNLVKIFCLCHYKEFLQLYCLICHWSLSTSEDVLSYNYDTNLMIFIIIMIIDRTTITLVKQLMLVYLLCKISRVYTKHCLFLLLVKCGYPALWKAKQEDG